MSSRGLTAICAIAAGALYCIVGLTHFLMPKENLLLASGVSRSFFESVASGSMPFTVHYWAFVLSSLFGIGVVSGLWDIMAGSESRAALRFTSILGIVGFSVTGLNFAFIHHQALVIAAKFHGLDASVQATIVATGLHNVDPYSLMSFGLVGVWSVAVSILSYRLRVLPRKLALVGCVGGTLYEMVFLGTLMGSEVLIDIAAAGAMVLGPVWFTWLGVFLVRTRDQSKGLAAES